MPGAPPTDPGENGGIPDIDDYSVHPQSVPSAVYGVPIFSVDHTISGYGLTKGCAESSVNSAEGSNRHSLMHAPVYQRVLIINRHYLSGFVQQFMGIWQQ